MANIHESDLSRVAEGDEVQVRTIAYPERIFKGSVKKIGTMLDPDSRVIKIRTELNNSEGLLKPEMFASIIVTSAHRLSIKAVPQMAVILENNRYYVMREIAKGKFEKVGLTIGRTFGDFYEVESGLNMGDRVVFRRITFCAYRL